MKKMLLLFIFITCITHTHAQEVSNADTAWKQIYRGTNDRINDLVHTKLDVRFDYEQSYLYGKAWITLQPYFYTTDSLALDAKGMEIKNISIVKGGKNAPLKYTYDSSRLYIKLDKVYKGGEKYTVYIDYIAKPDEANVEGSAAITDAKGLYFINPKGEKEGPTQIWTQGETEASSVWFPTIDKPNQKTTQEIAMTVPAKYVTLSNGLLTKQTKNNDGTRTDTWKMDLAHAPYLFFMGVGDYVIVKDKLRKMDVDYYVEKEYAPVARGIFGETPAMLAFFEKITGVEYVWPKYSQIVGRDYVSGAMENTTATLHQESAYQNARQLTEGNAWEGTIAHEIFHHWFGNLVTTESWSNLTLNESFANYSEYLWFEHRYGKDRADEHAFNDMTGYIMSGSDQKDLVRFYYPDKEAMFDAVSYNKGGRILHMLRNFVGDSAFFKSLNLFLTKHKFKSAEAQQLRLAFEEVTGKDLNWFWNQWFYGSGHPDLVISYDHTEGTSRVVVNQVQKSGKIFTLPIAIDVYTAANVKTRHNVWLTNKSDTFYFATAAKPLWINVDADKILLATKKDNKIGEEFEFQYANAKNYLDRREAIDHFAKNKMSALALGLGDRYGGIREFTLEKIALNKTFEVPAILASIENLAEKDPNKKVQAKALEILAKLSQDKYQPLFEKFIEDSSYSVAGAALEGLSRLNPDAAYTLAKKHSTGAKGKLAAMVSEIMYSNASEEDFEMLLKMFKNAPLTQNKIPETMAFANYLSQIKDDGMVRKGVNEIMKFRNMIPEEYRGYIDPAFKQAFAKISGAQKAAGNAEAAVYINGLIP